MWLVDMPVVIDGCYLLSWTPFFPWLNDLEHKWVELFPGSYIVFGPQLEDDILQTRLELNSNFHLVKAVASYSEETSFGLVSEFRFSEDIMDAFLEEFGVSTDYSENMGLNILTASALLFQGDYLMRRVLCTDNVCYHHSTSPINNVELKSIFWVHNDELKPPIIEKESFQDTLQWIWKLTFMLIETDEKGKLNRFLAYCASAQYHNNEFHSIINYYSALESLFNFPSGGMARNLSKIIPLISFFETPEIEEMEFQEYSEYVQKRMKEVSELRNGYAHGNTMKNRLFDLVADTTSTLEIIVTRVLMGIIDCGFLPNREQVQEMMDKNKSLKEMIKDRGFDDSKQIDWDAKKMAMYLSVDAAQNRFYDRWVGKE
jgi:hypothetical protein